MFKISNRLGGGSQLDVVDLASLIQYCYLQYQTSTLPLDQNQESVSELNNDINIRLLKEALCKHLKQDIDIRKLPVQTLRQLIKEVVENPPLGQCDEQGRSHHG